MATDVEINTVLNTDRSNDSLSQLRKGLKDLISLQGQVGAGSAQFNKLQKAINQTEGRISDLTTSFQTLRGNGVDRLNTSFGLLREGFLNADTGKLKIGLEGIGAAMKAIPVFLIIEGVRILISSFDGLKNSGGLLGETFTFLSKQIEGTRENFKRFTDDIGVTNHAEQELSDKRYERLKGESAAIAKRYDFEIKMAQASGKETIEIEREKVKAVAESVYKQVEYYQQLQKSGKELTDAQLKDVRELTAKANALIEERKLAEAKYRTESIKKEKERLEKEKEAGTLRATEFNRLLGLQQEYEEAVNAAKLADERATNQKIIDDYLESKQVEQAISELFRQQEKEAETEAERDRRLRLENELAYNKAFQQRSLNDKISALRTERDTLLQNEQLTQDQRIAIIEKSENDIFNLKVQKAQEFVNYARQLAGILNDLNTLRTQNENYELQQQQYQKDAAIQNDQNRTQEELDREELRKNTLLNNASLTASERERIAYESETRKRNIARASNDAQNKLSQDFAKKELEIKKKQFEREKALKIVTGVIQTASAVLQTLASVPYPANIPLAILAGAAGAAQVAIIASQKFDDGGAAAQSSVTPAQNIDTRGGISSGSSSPQPVSPRSFDPTGNVVNRNRNTTNSNGNPIYVTVTDIERVSRKATVLEERATFAD